MPTVPRKFAHLRERLREAARRYTETGTDVDQRIQLRRLERAAVEFTRARHEAGVARYGADAFVPKTAVPREGDDRSIDELVLSVRVCHVLDSRGIRTVGDLRRAIARGASVLRGLSEKHQAEVREVLAELAGQKP